METIDEHTAREINEIFESMNSKINFKAEKLKFWREDLLFRTPRGWGFIKIKGEQEKRRVLDSFKMVTERIPDISWILFDEGRFRISLYYAKEGKVKSI